MKVSAILLALLFSVTALSGSILAKEDLEQETNLSEDEVIEMAEEVHPLTEKLNLEGSEYHESQELWYLNYQSDHDDKVSYTLSFNICDEDEVIDSSSLNVRDLPEEEIDYVDWDEGKEMAEEFSKDAGFDLDEKEGFELEPKELTDPKTPDNYASDIDHRYEYRQTAHGYETDNSISVNVSSRTGHVSSFNNNYDTDLNFEEPKEVLAEETAKDLFIDAGGTLEYRTDTDNENFILTYSPIVGSEVTIDAETGDYLDQDGEVLDQGEVEDKGTEIDLEMGAFSPDKLDEPIDRRDDRERVMDKVKEVVDSKFDIEGEISTSGGGGSSTRGPLITDNVRGRYKGDDPRIELAVSFETEHGYLYEIRVDSRGDTPLVALGGEEYTEKIEKALTELEEDETEENFEQLGRLYFDKLAPDFVDYLDYDISLEEVNESFGKAYRLRFPVKAYGASLSYSSLQLTICQETAKLSRFNIRTPITDDYIDKPKDVISEEDALKNYLEKTSIEPKYGDDGDLVFEFDNKKYNQINAVTGELIERHIRKGYELSDIKRADDEKLIEWMSTLGVFIPDDDGVIDGEKTVSRGEATRVITSLTNTPRYTTPPRSRYSYQDDKNLSDVDEDHPHYHAIDRIYNLGLVPNRMLAGEESNEYKPDKEITREELAQMIVKTMNLEVITRSDDELDLAYEIEDKNEIHDKAWNSVAVVVALDIMSLEDDQFEPLEYMTRNEISQVFDRLIELGRLVQ
ncbi:S-layer homology domain-containing protein [Natranaerobius trueperi]|uniref:SLH domain-containing protein n=1 Tax=Natranaerobius trueperi TaxID=759412 RepID=A0A226BW05_9FIRM|nr:S-layer homology domain-containing protein [Natranaerobius trueperi]OWZ83155.1 hypothetical protein CDO51_10000 [Natranaerobius trueperi]